MPREKRDYLRDNFNVNYGSIQSLGYAVRKLQRDGLTGEQVLKGVRNLHPCLTQNLAVNLDGEIVAQDERLTWLRCAWVSKDVLPYIAALHEREYTAAIEYRWKSPSKTQERSEVKNG